MIKLCGVPSAVVLAVVAMSLKGCFDFAADQAQIDSYFNSLKLEPDYQTYQFEGRDMFYVRVGDPDLPMVLFVHGSPGGWHNFMHFVGDSKILPLAQITAVDRPGFGKSGRGRVERSMAKQAAAIQQIIARHNRPTILVGHSLGGPVITRMAMDFPDKIVGLILVAPSVDPALEKTKWFQIPANWKLFSWMVPKDLKTSNREILPLKPQLEEMVPLWEKLTLPVTVIQGGLDKLVPPGNADFAEAKLVNAPKTMVRVPEMDHFVPWTHPHLIRDAVLAHLQGLQVRPTSTPGPVDAGDVQ